MRGKLLITLAVLMLALLRTAAAVPRDTTTPVRDTVPVAIAQPLATMKGAPLVTMPPQDARNPMLPESAMLVLVGSALLGLAAIVRRTT